ncbi:hypothetical protein ZHAS_00010103 [Anopheles sinensis]|uniref:Uncharacterized protein n=1 Tax=Anopheles sinensis TaxID=74873 RepID=A0A084VWR4_ANOSI|nr:hypothetical protein ZHAS_00010103 [Anopheles sinensis]
MGNGSSSTDKKRSLPFDRFGFGRLVSASANGAGFVWTAILDSRLPVVVLSMKTCGSNDAHVTGRSFLQARAPVLLRSNYRPNIITNPWSRCQLKPLGLANFNAINYEGRLMCNAMTSTRPKGSIDRLPIYDEMGGKLSLTTGDPFLPRK